MRSMFKGVSEGMIGLSLIMFGGATIPPLMFKWATTLNELIQPDQPLFKRSGKSG